MFTINRHELRFKDAPRVRGAGYKFIIPVPETASAIQIPVDGKYNSGAEFKHGDKIYGADKRPIEGEGVVIFNSLHDHWVPAFSGKQGLNRRIIVLNLPDYEPEKIAVLTAKLKSFGPNAEAISEQQFYEFVKTAKDLGYVDFYKLRILNLEGMRDVGENSSLYGLKYREQRHPRRAVLLNSEGRNVAFNAFDCDPIKFNGTRAAILHPSGQVTLLDTETFLKTYRNLNGTAIDIGQLPVYTTRRYHNISSVNLGDLQITIIGGGVSGIFAATKLIHAFLEFAGKYNLKITIIDPKPELAGHTYNREGVAVPMATPIGMLGVDHPGALVEHMNRRRVTWENRGYKYEPGVGFSPDIRLGYNDYGAMLREHMEALESWISHTGKPISLNIVNGEVTDIRKQENGRRRPELNVSLGNKLIKTDIVIMALGNFEPRPRPELLGRKFYYNLDDRGLRPDNINETDEITIIGTGNGAHFAALSAFKNGFKGNIRLVSRTGRTPRIGYQIFDNGYSAQFLNEANIEKLVNAGEEITPALLLKLFKQEVRAARKEGFHWHRAVDAIIPSSNFIWSKMSVDNRAAFQKEFGNIWQNFRYRMPEEAAAKIDDYKNQGRLVVKGGLKTIKPAHGGGFELHLAANEIIKTPKVVNVTGPSQNVADMPVLAKRMCELGLISPCDLGGLLVDKSLRLVPQAGEGENKLPLIYGIGPITAGRFPESIAVPAIREQADELAIQLIKTLLKEKKAQVSPLL